MSTETDNEKFADQRMRFYALIGYCVTRYQTVEDYLPDVFAGAFGSNEDKAKAIFALFRGLEPKLDSITAALKDTDEHHQQRWQDLRNRIKKSAEARNEIAHAEPVQRGTLKFTPTHPSIGVRNEAPRMELHKRSKNAIWTIESMRAEYERCSKLLNHLVAFTRELNGEIPDRAKAT